MSQKGQEILKKGRGRLSGSYAGTRVDCFSLHGWFGMASAELEKGKRRNKRTYKILLDLHCRYVGSVDSHCVAPCGWS